jgi:hypothetical protein
MTDGEKKRLFLFEKYALNLKLIKEMGGLPDIRLKYEKTFICPICTDQFPIEALDTTLINPLTLEDAPPKSLGGKANTLTCKSCNNSCGQWIDWHLSQRLIEIDRASFHPNSEFYAKFLKDEKYVQGKIKIDSDGVMSALHTYKTNHPDKLDSYINSVGKDTIISFEFPQSKVDSLKLQYAILKTGYILMFVKYGYAFILSPTYDNIRKQLRFPEEKHFNTDFWVQAPYPEQFHGVPFIIEKGIEGIMSIFKVHTLQTTRTFSTILPLPGSNIEEPMKTMKKRFKREDEYYMTMDPMGPDTNYLENVEAITIMMAWITKTIK